MILLSKHPGLQHIHLLKKDILMKTLFTSASAILIATSLSAGAAQPEAPKKSAQRTCFGPANRLADSGY